MNVTVQQIAQVCHEANRGWQGARSERYIAQEWTATLLESRETTIQGVRSVLAGKSAEECHEEWVESYRLYGWRYGETKDEFQKTHPCMVPYNQLPDFVRMKNSIFAGIVKAMAEGNEITDEAEPWQSGDPCGVAGCTCHIRNQEG
ncbi:RyR domain-containing protein [Streptomyces sp. NPDC006477]|uniref:RyR domain-containing protein n=1 Tax=Streptomyces sp. NPDC006477 TaxID=3364747 RepID=UPI00369B93EF